MADFFKCDPSDVLKAFADLSDKDAPFITAYALTMTAKDIVAAQKASMAEVFDRPTGYTLNSLKVKSATKTDLQAQVFFKDEGGTPAWRYLGPEVEGGDRAHKSHELRLIRGGLMKAGEFVVPGKGVKLDAFGNIPGSLIEQILSQVGVAEQWSGYTANATKKTLKRAKKRGVGRYFLLRPDGSGPAMRAVQPGIYFRAGLKDIVPVLLFVTPPKYRKRFPFHDIARTVFDARLLVNAQAGFEKYVSPRAAKQLLKSS
jgi:hypothetical protein